MSFKKYLLEINLQYRVDTYVYQYRTMLQVPTIQWYKNCIFQKYMITYTYVYRDFVNQVIYCKNHLYVLLLQLCHFECHLFKLLKYKIVEWVIIIIHQLYQYFSCPYFPCMVFSLGIIHMYSKRSNTLALFASLLNYPFTHNHTNHWCVAAMCGYHLMNY